MKTEILRQFLDTLDAETHSRPSPLEYEMAYQARVSIERIRFAIRHIEQFASPCPQLREANLQLLDALGRLECVDRRFQNRSQTTSNGNGSQLDNTGNTENPTGNRTWK